MNLLIASDHAGFELKQYIKYIFVSKSFILKDLGVDKEYPEPKNSYPDIAKSLCLNLKDNDKGILICGSGIGMCIAANRFNHIRAAVCRNEIDATLSRLHNDANVICIGSRITDERFILQILNIFLTTNFEEGRHIDRVRKLSEISQV